MSDSDLAVLQESLRGLREWLGTRLDSIDARLGSHGRDLDGLEERLRQCELAGASSKVQLAAIVGGVSLLASGLVSVITKMIGG